MKATAQSLTQESAERLTPLATSAQVSHKLGQPELVRQDWFSVYADLFKARLTLLVLLTTLVGLYMGLQRAMDYWLMFHTLLGTALVAAGASALNQLLEREHDGKMRRTQTRPLPTGRLLPSTVLWIGCLSSILGLAQLAWKVNLLTSIIGALSLFMYLFVYTPLKRVSWLNTAAGAIPGALPPLMGWTAATGQLSGPGWVLFGILACWQIPHFLAIAWVYRDEYARAGFKMLPSVDPTGKRCAWQAVAHTVSLILVSLCPFLLKMAGTLYLLGAVSLGFLFLWFALRFSSCLQVPQARRLFFASILYLPLLLGLLVLDKK
jgi:heme o synthase